MNILRVLVYPLQTPLYDPLALQCGCYFEGREYFQAMSAGRSMHRSREAITVPKADSLPFQSHLLRVFLQECRVDSNHPHALTGPLSFPSVQGKRQKYIPPKTHPPGLTFKPSSPIIPVDSNILMTNIASPKTRLLLPPHAPPPQIHQNLQILHPQNLLRALLVHPLRLPPHHQPQPRAPVRGHEAQAGKFGDVDPGGDVGVGHGAEDATPVCVLAVEGCFDEEVAGDAAGDFVGRGVGGGVDDVDVDEFCGALAVADDQVREALGEGC